MRWVWVESNHGYQSDHFPYLISHFSFVIAEKTNSQLMENEK